MGRRAIFRAVIRAGEVAVPVKLYSAVRDERVHFHLLHADDQERLERRMVCSEEEEPVPREQRARGYEVARGQYVVLDPEEIADQRPETDREVEVLGFTGPGRVDPRLYHRLYHLGPDGDGEAYALLAAALDQAGRVAICRWTMRRRLHRGMLASRDGLLLLVTLLSGHELVPAETLDLERPEVRDRERESARDLVDALSGEWDPSAYHNRHQQRIMALIKDKARGEEPEVSEEEALPEVTRPDELQQVLEESLERARGS